VIAARCFVSLVSPAQDHVRDHASVRKHTPGPKKGVWNFQALKTPAFIEAGEFQTPFFGHFQG